MADLNDAREPRYASQIDSVGWMFAVVVIVITAIAGTVAYHGSDATVASPPVAHAVASR